MRNMIIGQSGGPTAVINSTLAGAYCAAKEAGVPKVFGMRGGIGGLLAGKYFDLDDFLKNDEDIRILRQTPSAALGSCRYKLPEPADNPQIYEKLFETLNAFDIDCVVYIGGNDSMDAVAKLSAYGAHIGSDIRFMGAPKTIDNDLAETDHSPGFGSAAKYIATSVKEIIRDSSVYDIRSVTVIEIMGRNAGWLAASAALARGNDCDGADMIYLPERSFDIESCTEKTAELLDRRGNVIIAVSEALRGFDGEYICLSGSVRAGLDDFGHRIMSGTGQFLANYLGNRLNVKARGIELSTLQRSAAHCVSGVDEHEAFELGAAAAKAAVDGRSAGVPVIRRTSDNPYKYVIEIADVKDIANYEKKVPCEWITEDGAYVTEDYIRYCLPLIQGEVSHITQNGIPTHMVFR